MAEPKKSAGALANPVTPNERVSYADLPTRLNWKAGAPYHCPELQHRSMRIYVAGPMTGLPLLNYPAFHAAAASLRAQGNDVENPAESNPPACGTWQGWMRLGVAQLVRCDAIYLLPGWERSKGAQIEHQLACSMELAVVYATGAAPECVGAQRESAAT